MSEMTPQEANTKTGLARIELPDVVDLEVIKTTLGPAIDKSLDHAEKLNAAIAANIANDEDMRLAVDAVERVRQDASEPLEKWKADFYEPAYREMEARRELLFPRIKRAQALVKSLLGHVSDYRERKRREAEIARERAEAEARRQREEAERLAREAVEAERRAKEAAEAEVRRKREADEAEARRVQAEKDEQARLEREAREKAAAETKRRLEEEEAARIRHAEVAHQEGNGAAKVDAILESPKPISPVIAKPQGGKDSETLRLEEEQRQRVAHERALNEAHEAAVAEEASRAARAEAERLKKQAAEAAQVAASAQAAAAAVPAVIAPKDSRTYDRTTWTWDLDSDGSVSGDRAAVYALLEAILKTRGTREEVPLEAIGYNNEKPQDFRPSRITKEVNDKKSAFNWPGIRAYPQTETLMRRKVGGRR